MSDHGHIEVVVSVLLAADSEFPAPGHFSHAQSLMRWHSNAFEPVEHQTSTRQVGAQGTWSPPPVHVLV
jgi:hypothetical protein